ncbi:ABC transporter permease [Ornithinimicrobium sp. Y1847]|uniref:ABC transporter permease n=1 Tax=Ornithinimicrobium sp. Y1847 TaxID=3405419 RepID=UPI003B67C84B
MSTIQTEQPGATGQSEAARAAEVSDDRRPAWPLVAMREIQVRLRDRNFLMSTALSVFLLMAVILANHFFGGMGTGGMNYKIGVEGQQGTTIVQQAETYAGADSSLEAVELADAAAVESATSRGEVDYGLLQTDAGWELVDEGPTNTELQMAVGEAVRSVVMAQNAEAAGTDLGAINDGTVLTTRDLSAGEDGSNPGLIAFILGFVFAFLFYMSSLMFGMQIASSVVEEKQSRLVEILAAAIPIRSLLVGKVLGNTALAFAQLLLFVAVGLIGLSFTDMASMLPGMTEGILWYIPFFVLGFLALACIWAAAGSLASRNEDLQATTMPLTMVLVLIFVVGLQLQGTWREIGSFIPVMSTILMPMRILEGEAAWWEPVVALVLVLAFCALTISFGVRLYRRSVMHTSGTLTWRKALTLKD